jgi:hypothetical protein
MMTGALGEIAFAKYLGRPADRPREAPDGGVDFVVDGYRVQVKATTWPNGRLLLPAYQELTADFYVLARVSIPDMHVTFAGAVTAADVQACGVVDESLPQAALVVPSRELRPLRRSLWAEG